MDDPGPPNPASVPPPDEPFVHNDLPEPSFIEDDEPPTDANRDDLDANRIRQVTKLRRAAYRSRGFLLIGSAFCAVLAVQLIWNSVGRFRGGSFVIASSYLMAASILFALAWLALKRAQHFKREADATALHDPKTPPDFSPLRDGSQAWKNLEDM